MNVSAKKVLFLLYFVFIKCKASSQTEECFKFFNRTFCCQNGELKHIIRGSTHILSYQNTIPVTSNCTTYRVPAAYPDNRINVTRVFVDLHWLLNDFGNMVNQGTYVIIEGLQGYRPDKPWKADKFYNTKPLGLSATNNITIKITKLANFMQNGSMFNLTYEEVNPCRPDPCYNGICIPNEDYTGHTCDNGLFCDSSEYIYANVTLTWPKIPAGEAVEIPCPASATGTVKITCSLVDNMAVTQRPDLTGCVSKEMKSIADQAQRLSSSDDVSKHDIINVTDGIASVLSGNGSATITILPGDLAVATETMATVSKAVSNTTEHPVELAEIAKGYGAAVDEIVDPVTEKVWRQTEFDFAEHKIKTLLTSVETLSANVAKKREEYSRRRRRSTDRHTMADSIDVESRNMDFHIKFRERVALCEESTDLSIGENNSITLTASVFAKAVRNSEGRFVPVYTGSFRTIPSLLEATQDEQNKYRSENDTKTTTLFNSDIVSTSILNVPEGTIAHLTRPVSVVFRIKNESLWFGKKPKCVFMNMSEEDAEKRWISEGCKYQVQLSNITHVTCVCDHLTNFAIIMDVFDIESRIDANNNRILTYISYVGGGLSVLGCIITVIVFEFFRLRKERIRIHEQLALSIVATQVIFLAGIDRTGNKYVCMGIAIALHYFLLTMFGWMLIEGFHLYLLLVRVFKKNDNFKKYLIIGWGLPCVIVALSAGLLHDEYGNDTACWISNRILLMAFVPVVGLVIVSNTVVLSIVLRIMTRSFSASTRANEEDRSSVRSGLKAAAILLPLLGLTWTLGFFSVNNKDTLIFTYLFTILNSLQGVFFFVFHCLLSIDVQNAYERRSLRKSRSSLASTFNKRKDMDNYLSSSTNTLLTETSSSSATRKSSPTSRVHDRIHRDSMTYDNYGQTHDKHKNNALLRSYSDGVPYWRRKVNSRHEADDRYAGPPEILRNDYFFDDHQDISYVIPYNRPAAPTYNDRSPLHRSVEELYSKPLKRKSSSLPRTMNTQSNHVHFLDQTDFNSTNLDNGLISVQKLGQKMSEKQITWTKTFLEELQERAAQIGIRDYTENS